MLGVRSGIRSCTPYVERRKSREPVRRTDAWSVVRREPATTAVEFATEAARDLGALEVERRSWQRRASGGRRRIGYMER